MANNIDIKCPTQSPRTLILSLSYCPIVITVQVWFEVWTSILQVTATSVCSVSENSAMQWSWRAERNDATPQWIYYFSWIASCPTNLFRSSSITSAFRPTDLVVHPRLAARAPTATADAERERMGGGAAVKWVWCREGREAGTDPFWDREASSYDFGLLKIDSIFWVEGRRGVAVNRDPEKITEPGCEIVVPSSLQAVASGCF